MPSKIFHSPRTGCTHLKGAFCNWFPRRNQVKTLPNTQVVTPSPIVSRAVHSWKRGCPIFCPYQDRRRRFLSPLQARRIRSVLRSSYAHRILATGQQLVAECGAVNSLYPIRCSSRCCTARLSSAFNKSYGGYGVESPIKCRFLGELTSNSSQLVSSPSSMSAMISGGSSRTYSR